MTPALLVRIVTCRPVSSVLAGVDSIIHALRAQVLLTPVACGNTLLMEWEAAEPAISELCIWLCCLITSHARVLKALNEVTIIASAEVMTELQAFRARLLPVHFLHQGLGAVG